MIVSPPTVAWASESPAPDPMLGAPDAPLVPADDFVEAIDTPQGAIPIDPPGLPEPGIDSGPNPQHLGDKILFVNFDGADMNWCGNNSPHQNCSTIFQGTVLPYSGDAAKRASVIQVIRKRVEDFGITVTNQRPDSGDYDMEMVGNWQGESPSFAGVAPGIDCWDNKGGEVSFTLEKAGTADGIAEIVLQELAHTWGLEHVDEQQDLLFPTTQGTNKTFRDECIKIVSDTMLTPSGGSCNSVHTNYCDSGWQNSYRELLLVFGESVPDTSAPAVEIVSPAEDEMVEGDFDMVIALEDDQTPAVIDTTIVLESDALAEPQQITGAYASPTELSFPISGLPDGVYNLRVDITDESDNPAFDEVTFTMAGGMAGGDSGGADGGGSGGGTGGPSGTTSGAASDDGGGSDDGSVDGGTSDGGDTDPGQMGEMLDEGCGCTSDRPGLPLGLSALFLLALPAIRRR